MNLRKLVDSLNLFCDCLNSSYDINCGGCCFLAYVLAKHFDKIGIKYDLVVFNDSTKNQQSITEEITNFRSNTCSPDSITGRNTCIHYCLQVDGIGMINANSDYCLFKYDIKGINSKNICWIYKTGSWNQIYDVKHNKTVDNILKHFFKEYEQ